jgi:hypothetical protein
MLRHFALWFIAMVDRLLAWAQRQPRPAIAFGLSLPVALFYALLLLGLRTFPNGDFTHHFLDFSLFQARALATLRLPLWNPHTFGGHPFLADTQAAVFYPLSNLLLAATLPLRSDAARLYLLQWEAVAQTALAGWFVYLLVAELVHIRWAALLAGITFALSGYLVAYPPLQLAVLRTAIWLPLILWLLLRTAHAPQAWRWPLWSAAALAAAFAAGHPQTFLYITYVTVAWSLLLVGMAARNGGWAAARLGARLAVAALLALGLAAVQLLPSLEFTRLSVRADVSYAFVSGGLPLRDTWQLLLPRVFTWYSPLYVGVPALMLSGAALLGLRRHRDKRTGVGAATLFFAVLALAALLLAYGGNAFLYPIFYRIAPGWDWFRGQERAAYMVALALSVLAGLGAASLPALRPAERRRLAAVFAAIIVAATYAFGLLWQLQGTTALGNGGYLAVAVMTMVAAVTAALALWLPGWSERRSLLLYTITVVTLFGASYGRNLDAGTPADKVRLAPEVAAVQAAVGVAPHSNLGIAGRVYNEFRTEEDYAMRLTPPAAEARPWVEDLWGSSPLRLANYTVLSREFPLDRWWRLFGVEHLLTWRREIFEPSTLLGEFPQETDTTYLHQLGATNPRAWFVTQTQAVDDTTALQLLADHTFDIDAIALLPKGTSEGALPPASAAITLTQPAPGQLGVRVEANGAGILLLAENWMPGWRVKQIRRPAVESPILGLSPYSVQRADLTLLAVPLPAGASSFTLRYAPNSVRVGLWISSASLLLLALGLALTYRRRRHP